MRVLAPPFLVLALAAPPAAPGSPDPGVWRGLVSILPAPLVNPCVSNVTSALTALDSRGVTRGFRYESAPALDGLFSHFQGITRLPGDAEPWMVVSRSGSSQAVAIVGPKGIVAEITAPEGLTHAGGIQTLGDVLAVPYEHKSGRSTVILYDMSNRSKPRHLYELDRSDVPAPSLPGHASAVALARLADGRVVMIVGVKSSKVLDVYLSNHSDLTAPGLHFTRVTTLLDAVEGRFQSHNLVTQCDGTLYLVGTYNTGFPPPTLGSDVVRWYRLEQAPSGAVRLVEQGKRKIDCEYCNFGAAAGVYVGPKGDLVLYGIEHRDTGPNRTVYYEEFRARNGKPSLPTGG